MNKQRGFSLIELMIVVAIVAIIAAVAYPSYQSQMLKTRRADAHSTLTDISARLERFRAANNRYTIEISGAAGLNLGSTTSLEGFYNMTVAAGDFCGNNNAIARCYTITARPTGPQAQDTECATISLSSNGVKSSTPAGGDCW